MHRFIISGLSAACLLSACAGGTVQQTLGIERSAPDEFKVVARPPLSVPPQFNLRPPGSTGESAAGNLPMDQQAQSLVLGGSGETFPLKDSNGNAVTTAKKPAAGAAVSSAESQLLKNAGAEHSDPAVRSALIEERIAVQEKKEERSWWDLGLWTPEKKEPLVDAKKEAERLKKNQEEGKPANTGETPETKARDRGVLGTILGD